LETRNRVEKVLGEQIRSIAYRLCQLYKYGTKVFRSTGYCSAKISISNFRLPYGPCEECGRQYARKGYQQNA
jgi:hypothetical protein